MLAFEVTVNGKKVCTAGIEGYGVLHTYLTWIRRQNDAEYKPGSEELDFSVGASNSDTGEGSEHVRWLTSPMTVGDVITVRIIESEQVDEPYERKKENPKQREKNERAYFERMKIKYGRVRRRHKKRG